MKKLFVLILMCFLICGCSKGHILAKYYLTKAENAYLKAYALRVKPEASEERMKYYRKAHDCYIKAYKNDPSAFTLSRIDQAHETCLRVEDKEGEAMFQKFADDYTKAHPKEAEWGDAAPMVGLE